MYGVLVKFRRCLRLASSSSSGVALALILKERMATVPSCRSSQLSCVDPVDLHAECVQIVGGDARENLASQGVAAALQDLLGDFKILTVDPFLRVDITPYQMGVVTQEGDDRVLAINKHKGLVVDRDDPVVVEVGRGVLGELLVPFVHFVVETLGFIDCLRGRGVGFGQDGVGVLLAQLGDLSWRYAIHLDA